MEERNVLPVKRMRPGARLPQRQTEGAAGFDLCACLEAPVTLAPGEGFAFPTGCAVEIPPAMVGLVFCRSSLGARKNVSLPNGVGVIDSDYRGELIVPLRNDGHSPYTVQPGERVAQLVVVPVWLPAVEEATELSATQRGQGGFGSTGR